MRSSVCHAVFLAVVRKVGVFRIELAVIEIPGELKDLHAWKAAFLLHQLHLRCQDSKIFAYDVYFLEVLQ